MELTVEVTNVETGSRCDAENRAIAVQNLNDYYMNEIAKLKAEIAELKHELAAQNESYNMDTVGLQADRDSLRAFYTELRGAAEQLRSAEYSYGGYGVAAAWKNLMLVMSRQKELFDLMKLDEAPVQESTVDPPK